MAKQNKEYVYVDCYQCDENGKSSPWKRKHLDDVPKWQHEEAKDFNCFATVQKYANEKKTEGEDFLAPLYFDLDYSENPAVAQKKLLSWWSSSPENLIYRNRTYIFTFPGLRASIFW